MPSYIHKFALIGAIKAVREFAFDMWSQKYERKEEILKKKEILKKRIFGGQPESNPGHLGEPLSDPSESWLKLAIATFWL